LECGGCVGLVGDSIFPVSEKSFFRAGFSEEIGFQQAKQAVFRAQKPVVAGSVFFKTILCLHQRLHNDFS
jgi:hypothetical protein